MSRYLVQYSPAAYEDLRAIYHYIAVELMVPETAENQTARIRSAVRALDTLPYRYAAVDWEPWNSAGMRKVSVGHYVIFYCVDEKTQTVTIVRIFYGGRDIEEIIKETLIK